MFHFKCIHPILFSVYPVLFLVANNPNENIYISSFLGPMLISLVFLLIIWFVSRLIIGKSINKRTLFTSIIVLFFFSYGHLYEIFKHILIWFNGTWKIYIFEVFIGPNKILLPLLILFIFWLTLQIRSSIKDLSQVNNFFSLVSLITVSFVLIQISMIKFDFIFTFSSSKTETHNLKRLKSKNIIKNAETYPDIYYIILDSYANSKTLKDFYGNDNSDFLNFLREKGFFVNEKSFSNYRTTHISIASSLNMTYLNYLNDMISENNIEKKIKTIRYIIQEDLTKKNKVISFLRDLGYVFVNFNSGIGATANMNSADKQIECGKVDEFSVLFYRSTIFGSFDNHLRKFGLSPITGDLRSRILCQFDTLPKIQNQFKKPVFILNHILAPHPPFIFGPNGEDVTNTALKYDGEAAWKDRTHYLGQLLFLNHKLEEIINKILEQSKVSPIIIIQGDHGPASLEDITTPTPESLRERMGILNSFYLPNLKIEKPYDNLSPVNTFRFIFNSYFGANLPLLEDKAYYSDAKNEYKFIDVTDIINQKSFVN